MEQPDWDKIKKEKQQHILFGQSCNLALTLLIAKQPNYGNPTFWDDYEGLVNNFYAKLTLLKEEIFESKKDSEQKDLLA